MRVANRKAFTLVELLVVIAIISLLASMLLPALQNALASARITTCAASMRQVGLADEMYRNDFNGWMHVYKGSPRVYQSAYGLETLSSYLHELYPQDIRICPTLTLELEGGRLSWTAPRPSHFSNKQYLAWAYSRPALHSNNVVQLYGMNATADFLFARPAVKFEARDARRNDLGWEVPRWTVTGNIPMLSDLNWRLIGTPQRWAVAHNDGPGSTDYQTDPGGGNSLWIDGSVNWHQWDGWPPIAFLEGIGPSATISEGWCKGIEDSPFWGRSGR